MAELIAQGPKADQTWRQLLQSGESFVLGRFSPPWSVPWDTFISRQHVRLTWKDGYLSVEKLPSGRNPVLWNGAHVEQFQIAPGDSFVIGETTFLVEDTPPDARSGVSQMIREHTFNAQELGQTPVNAAHQLAVLRQLPEMIARAANEAQLFERLGSLLLAGLTMADVVGLVTIDADESPAPGRDEGSGGTREIPGSRRGAPRPQPATEVLNPVHVLRWSRRVPSSTAFQPSNRLVLEAVRRQETVLHVWAGNAKDDFTHQPDFDWAFCTPVRGRYAKGWAIYAGGRLKSDFTAALSGENDDKVFLDDVKFTELVAAIWSALNEANHLKHLQGSFGQFFSPSVLAMLAEHDPEEILQPRQADVTVMFCDLRGFSRAAERRDLLAFLESTSQALGLMTRDILAQGGVIGDFQGDAAMGFWGWPISQPDAPRRACLAALSIRAALAQTAHPQRLASFPAGIGMASGPAVAGKIGTVDQVKITVFGPVVNLASRLEGMTKLMGVPIVVDEATARMIGEQLPLTAARLRRLAKVRPYGMATELFVSELLPPYSQLPLLTDDHLRFYEEALEAFIRGDWDSALEILHQLPAEDRGKDFLTAFILTNRRIPPEGWDGVIPLTSKG